LNILPVRQSFISDQSEIANHQRNMLTDQRDCITGHQEFTTRRSNKAAGRRYFTTGCTESPAAADRFDQSH
jgi:hypothetical protein